MKKILAVLKSGKEGYYPDLARVTEERLLSLLPAQERERVLRIRKQVTPDEIAEAEMAISAWMEEVKARDEALKRLADGGSSSTAIFHDSSRSSNRSIPPVRGRQVVAASQNAGLSRDNAFKSDNAPQEKIKGFDFPAWEKWDVDKALAEVDAKEEERLEDMRASMTAFETTAAARRSRLHQAEMKRLLAEMDAGGLTPLQQQTVAGKTNTHTVAPFVLLCLSCD
jgi:hypothetical protein